MYLYGVSKLEDKAPICICLVHCGRYIGENHLAYLNVFKFESLQNLNFFSKDALKFFNVRQLLIYPSILDLNSHSQ